MASPEPNSPSHSPPSPSSAPPEPDVNDADATLPMTMAASVVLDNLPKDATRALETAGEIELAKGMYPFFSSSPSKSPDPPAALLARTQEPICSLRSQNSDNPPLPPPQHALPPAASLQVLFESTL